MEKRQNLQASRRRTASGFTLVELIVVIAIIGILSAILIPSLIGYISKANRRADASTARVIYDDVMTVLYADDSLYDSYQYGVTDFKETAYSSFYHHNNCDRQKTIQTAEGTETCQLKVVASMDSTNDLGGHTRYVWVKGNNESLGFVNALNTLEGFNSNSKKNAIRIHSTKYEGCVTNRWYICYRREPGRQEEIEIWVGDNGGENSTQPEFRLYPNPSLGY